MGFATEVAAATDVGCVRSNNEDNFGYDRRHGIYVVCDGMGGEAAGEVASKIAVDTVLAYFDDAAKNHIYPVIGKAVDGVSERATSLASAIQLANRTIRRAAEHDPEEAGMGSTLAAVWVQGKSYSIAHVGDSRIYLLRPQDDSIQQLTDDHSLVMEQVRRGLLTMEQAQQSEMQNVIIRALGCAETVEPDLDDRKADEGDILLLTTDGLTHHIYGEEILGIVKTASTLQEACNRLIQAAKNAGGQDNITCLLLRFVGQNWIQGLFSGSAKNRETAQVG